MSIAGELDKMTEVNINLRYRILIKDKVSYE